MVSVVFLPSAYSSRLPEGIIIARYRYRAQTAVIL